MKAHEGKGGGLETELRKYEMSTAKCMPKIDAWHLELS